MNELKSSNFHLKYFFWMFEIMGVGNVNFFEYYYTSLIE